MKYILTLSILLSITITDKPLWLSDFEHAKKLAKEQNRKLILVFQGSDWCAPCIKLDKQIWSTKEFNEYATENFIMVKADFPMRKKNKLSKQQQSKNDALAELYNPHGNFPLVVIFDSNGTLIGKTSYKKMSVKEYIKHLNSFVLNK